MNINDMRMLLESLPQPSVLFSNGEFISSNEAARELLGDALSLDSPADFFGRALVDSPGQLVGSVVFDGTSYVTTATGPLDCRIITVSSMLDRSSTVPPPMAMGILNSLSATTMLAVEQLQSHVTGDEDAMEALCLISRTSYSISRIVGGIMFLKDTEAGELVPEYSTFDLVEFCGSIVGSAQILCSDKNIAFRWDSNAASIRFSGDKLMLTRLFLNLISNSVRYAGKGGRITLELNRAASGTYVSVSDNGPGMSFTRQFSAIRDGGLGNGLGSGAGLGLAICRNIAAAHGGSIVIGTRKGSGTVVTVYLPDRDPPTHSRNGRLHLTEPRGVLLPGISIFLTELADVLSPSVFCPERLAELKLAIRQ